MIFIRIFKIPLLAIATKKSFQILSINPYSQPQIFCCNLGQTSFYHPTKIYQPATIS